MYIVYMIFFTIELTLLDTHVNRSTISVVKYAVTSPLHHLGAHIFVQMEEDVSALVALI